MGVYQHWAVPRRCISRCAIASFSRTGRAVRRAKGRVIEIGIGSGFGNGKSSADPSTSSTTTVELGAVHLRHPQELGRGVDADDAMDLLACIELQIEDGSPDRLIWQSQEADD